MEKETIEALLAKHSFFKELRSSYLTMIAGCGSNVRFRKGQYLCREGEEANRFYAIRHGSVALELYIPQRGPVIVQTLGEGDLLGWSWLFPPNRWQFDARAQETVRATSFDGACLRGKCEVDPEMGYHLMKRLAHVVSDRLEATRLQLLDVYGNSEKISR